LLKSPPDSPIEIIVGSIFLYKLLGVSCLFGLAVTCLFLPLNHFAGKIVVGAQDNLMKARDERVALMNEVRAFSWFMVTIPTSGPTDPRWNPHAQGASSPLCADSSSLTHL
jgi:hypothetical protein